MVRSLIIWITSVFEGPDRVKHNIIQRAEQGGR
jgi:hypothetical protein